MRIGKNKDLGELTTFKIGGRADFFVEAETPEEITSAIEFARLHNIPVFILGGGSNILISDDGFRGLVLKISIGGIEVIKNLGDSVVLKIGAGVVWDDLVKWSVENNLWGIENLSFIPGNVGAAPVQNIGAYGSEVSDSVVDVDAIDLSSLLPVKFFNKECEFGYRQSIFKKEKRRYAITSISLKLSKTPLPNLSYPGLESLQGKDDLSPPDVRRRVIDIRRQKLPDVGVFGTAGSFFKNPTVSGEEEALLKKRFTELPTFDAPGGRRKVSLAWIIDRVCGMKGFRSGDVGIYEKHSLVIVNYGNGSASEVIDLAKIVTERVKELSGLDIEWEVESV